MIKNIFYIILFSFSMLFSQTSSMSFYGQGEYLNSFNASSIALGNSKYFGENSLGFSVSSPSTYYKSSDLILATSLKISENKISNVEKMMKNNFELFFISIPIDRFNSISFGMKPIYRSDIKLTENDFTYISAEDLSPLINNTNPLGLQGPMKYISSFDFNGGLSELFLVYSAEIDDEISVGISYSKIFGTSKYKYSVDLYSLSYSNTGELLETSFSENNYVINTQEYSSSRYLFELRYQLKNMNLVLDYSTSESLKIRLNEQVQFTNSIFDQNTYSDLGKMENYGLGLNYIFSNKLTINSEFRYLDSFKPLDFLSIFSYKNPDIMSFGFGANYTLDTGSDIYNDLSVSFGLYNDILSYQNFDVYDRGFTFGFGIEYLEKKNSMNFAFKIGTRKSDYLNFNDEKYFNFYFTIISSDKWFNNERDK